MEEAANEAHAERAAALVLQAFVRRQQARAQHGHQRHVTLRLERAYRGHLGRLTFERAQLERDRMLRQNFWDQNATVRLLLSNPACYPCLPSVTLSRRDPIYRGPDRLSLLKRIRVHFMLAQEQMRANFHSIRMKLQGRISPRPRNPNVLNHLSHRVQLVQRMFRGFHSRKHKHNFYLRKHYLEQVAAKGEEIRVKVERHYQESKAVEEHLTAVQRIESFEKVAMPPPLLPPFNPRRPTFLWVYPIHESTRSLTPALGEIHQSQAERALFLTA